MQVIKTRYNFKIMKNIKSNIYLFKALVLSFALFVTSCGDEIAVDDPADAPSALSFDLGEDSYQVESNESTYDITVQATSVSNVDRTVSMMVNEAGTTATTDQYSFSPQATIPAGSLTGSTTLSFDYDVLNFGDSRTLMLDLVLAESDTPNIKRQEFQLDFVKQCTANNVVLDLTFDAYAEEAYWDLYDLSGTPTIILSGGQNSAYGDLDNSSLSLQLCLEAGDSGIVVYDT
jgi:hypothetical protein